jgi:hypothetical protein
MITWTSAATSSTWWTKQATCSNTNKWGHSNPVCMIANLITRVPIILQLIAHFRSWRPLLWESALVNLITQYILCWGLQYEYEYCHSLERDSNPFPYLLPSIPPTPRVISSQSRLNLTSPNERRAFSSKHRFLEKRVRRIFGSLRTENEEAKWVLTAIYFIQGVSKKKKLYSVESLCKCIQRTCTVFWTVIM